MCSEFKGWGFDQEGSQLWYVGRLEQMVLALAMYRGGPRRPGRLLGSSGATRKKQGSKATRTLELQENRRCLVSWLTRGYVACKTASICPPFLDPSKVIGDEILKINF
jgi:hypothetical protein